MPKAKLIEFRDTMSSTPGAADNMIKSVKALFVWACDRGIAKENPAIGIPRINKGKGGAIPWSIADLHKFKQTHQKGTQAHLALTLFMFTACRISDAIILGRGHELEYQGLRTIRWQPQKTGSAEVHIPMLPALFEATRGQKIQGTTYLLTEHGRPFSSSEGFRNRFKKWCLAAGLENRSSHGIRKAAGELLAEYGCTQHEIMSVHGHTQAKTSEVYTQGADRWRLAQNAMSRLSNLQW